MKFTNLQKLNDFKQFINEISSNDKLAVIYDTDMDGISSGVLTVKALEKLNVPVTFQRSRSPGTRFITDDLINIFKEKKITHIIFLDLPVEGYKNSDVLNNYNVLVIDHHPVMDSFNKNFLLIKSFDMQKEVSGAKYCTAKLSYDLFEQLLLTKMESLDWISALGVIGDITYDVNKEWVDNILRKNNLEIKNNPFDTGLGELVQYATYATCIGTQEEINKVFSAIYSAKNYSDAIKNLDHLNSVKEDFEKKVNDFDKFKEEFGDTIFYEFTSPYFINSPVCTVISLNKLKNKTLITVHKKNSIANISARRQDKKLDMGKMLHDSVVGLLDANGGGHPVAAGAKVKISDYNTFKKNVLEWVKNNE